MISRRRSARREVLLTRARRDARSPTIASRFWLRLQALAGERFERARRAGRLDARARRSGRASCPPSGPRRRRRASCARREISVTEVDRLKADPYAFYAKRILRLAPLDPVDADPSAAWRGTAVHDVLEAWCERGRLRDPTRCAARAGDAGRRRGRTR